MTSGATQKRPTTRRFDSPEQEAFLSLWRTYDRLRALEDELFAGFDLTPQQYNALRLLRAEHPDPVPTLALADRLVSRAPDITRLLDKLEHRGLLARTRKPGDRRSVLVGITPQGMALLDEIAGPLRGCHARQLGHLSHADLKTLTALLHAARAPHEPDGSVWK
jgi:DNA-binding MarR family transcriptional regulator